MYILSQILVVLSDLACIVSMLSKKKKNVVLFIANACYGYLPNRHDVQECNHSKVRNIYKINVKRNIYAFTEILLWSRTKYFNPCVHNSRNSKRL